MSKKNDPIPLPLTVALNKTIAKANKTFRTHVRSSNPQAQKKYVETASWIQTEVLNGLEKRLDVMLSAIAGDDFNTGGDLAKGSIDQIGEKLVAIEDKMAEIKRNTDKIEKEKDSKKKLESVNALIKDMTKIDIELEIQAKKVSLFEDQTKECFFDPSEGRILHKILDDIQKAIASVDIFPYANEKTKVVVKDLGKLVNNFSKRLDSMTTSNGCSSNTAAPKGGSTDNKNVKS